jgi:cell division protein DivIC
MTTTILNKIPSWLKNKYILATMLFLLFIIFLDDNNVFYQYKLYKEQKKLAAITTNLQEKIKDAKAEDNKLQKNPLTIEKIAREKYGMRKENEVVFLFPETK